MKARLIRDQERNIILLLADGTYIEAPSASALGALLFNFKNIETFKLGNGAKVWTNDYPSIVAFPGCTLAYVTDLSQLVIEDVAPFLSVFDSYKATVPIENAVSVNEYATMHNKSPEQIKAFCRKGRIWGAKKIGRDWVIPENAPYPSGARIYPSDRKKHNPSP